MKSCLNQKCIHGHDLKSINDKMARKKRGSKSYYRAKDHQVNYVNWSIKQLNLGQFGEIRLENNKNIKNGNRTSKSLRSWSYSQIHKTISLICEETNVSLSLQRSPYKSQRCNSCGYTHKMNRKAKHFECNHCGFICDADLNSAKNNSIELFDIPFTFMSLKLNHSTGFIWTPNGLFDLSGQAITVPA